MQPQLQQSSRADLVDLKNQIGKRVGVERFKKYFYYLNRFLSQKLSKSDFNKSCFHLLGRENLSLHNQLIRSILKNACQAKFPPPTYDKGTAKSGGLQIAKSSPSRDDGHEQSGPLLPNHNQNVSIWSNGVLPMSPRKIRSGIRDRKHRDRPSPLGPSGKVDCISHLSTGIEDTGGKVGTDNGELPQYDYQRLAKHLQAVAELPDSEMAGSIQQPCKRPRVISKDSAAFSEDGEEVEQANRWNFSRSSLLAPLGIPFHSASVGGARRAMLAVGSSDFVSYYDDNGLYNTEILRKRMEHIAAAQGVEGVSMECANMLNNMLDVYLKRLIKSCVDLVGARYSHDPRKHQIHKQQLQGKVKNGMWPVNHLHMQCNSGPMEIMHEQRSCRSISLLDFKVAMELNPQQLGEDWPLMLEKICMQAFED